MPYYFTCPTCKKNNYGYKDPPVGKEYYDDMQCSMCGQKGIAWVAHSKMNISTPKNLWAIGAFESDIAYLNPTAATGNTEMALQKLTAVATLVSSYSQGARSDAFTPNIKAVGEGQCAGQCLHWIRRVLQGGRAGYLAPTQKGKVIRTEAELSNKYKKQSVVGAKAQMVVEDHRKNASGEKIAELDQKVHKILTSLGFTDEGDGWSYSFSSPEEKQKKQQALKKVQDKRNEVVKQMNEEGMYSYAWDDMARELDQTLDKLGVKKKFSNIVSLQCINRAQGSKFKTGTANSFAAAIVGNSDFQSERAAALSIGLKIGIGEKGGKISGHAIAVHYAGPNELYLFDPNLGIFRTHSPGAMKSALEIMMGAVWTAMGWQLDGSFGYAFFKAKVVPTPKSSEKEVDYSSNAPTVTAMKNMSIGTLPSVTSGGPSKTTTPTVTKKPVTSNAQVFAPQGPPQTAKPGGGGKLNPKLLEKFGGS